MSQADTPSDDKSSDPNPCRVNPNGLINELENWQGLNWRPEDPDDRSFAPFDPDAQKVPKRPKNPTVNAKSNDASTWGDFDRALTNALENDDLGFAFPCAQPGHDLVFADVDVPGDWTPGYDGLGGCVVEWSPSSENQRAILTGVEIPEWYSSSEWSHSGKGTPEVKLFSDTGYVTLTGDSVDGYEPPLEETHQLAFEKWLKECWYGLWPEADDGDEPWKVADESNGRSDDYDGDEWLTDKLVAEALDHLDPDMDHDEWIKFAYTVYDYDSGSRGKSLFKSWSKQGTKWDENAQREIESVWSGATVATGPEDASVATLVYCAKKNGWKPPNPKGSTDETATAETDSELIDAIEADWFDSDEKTVRVESTADYTTDELTDLFQDPSDLLEECGYEIIAKIGEMSGGGDYLDSPDDWAVEPAEPNPWTEVQLLFSSDQNDAPAITRGTQLLLDEFDIATNSQNGTIYVYENGAYHANNDNTRVAGEAFLRDYLNNARGGKLGSQGTRPRTDNILKKTQDSTAVPIADLGGPDGMVCVKNGALDISDPSNPDLLEHSPEYLFTSQLNVNYDPEADCPRFKQFIGETVRAEDIPKLQEYCGYLLMHWDQRYKKALMLLGPNDSGKSTLSDTLAHILGERNVSGESMHDLAENRFSPANLVDKLANINAELDSDGIRSIGTFKKLTGNERTVRAEEKHEGAFTFRCTAKMLFAANRVPDIGDADDAFYERMLLVSMPNTFSRSERDPELKGRLRSEADGILNWMLEGYNRLLEQGRFSDERDLESKRDFWEAYGSPVDRFKQECLTVTGDTDDLELKQGLYDKFIEYCQAKGLAFGGTQSKFTQKLTGGKISDGYRTGDDWNGQKYVYVGVKLDTEAFESVVKPEATRFVDDSDDDDDTRGTSLESYDDTDSDDSSGDVVVEYDESESESGSSDSDPKGGQSEGTTSTDESDKSDGSGWGQLLADLDQHYTDDDEITPENLIDRVDRITADTYAELGLSELAEAGVLEEIDNGVYRLA